MFVRRRHNLKDKSQSGYNLHIHDRNFNVSILVLFDEGIKFLRWAEVKLFL